MHGLSRRSSFIASAFVAAICGSTASAQWTAVILEPGSPILHAEAVAVHGNRQGGRRDDGLSVPRLWTGSAESGITLVEPNPGSGSYIAAITATGAFGTGYITISDTDGFYAALLWNQSGSSVTVFPPPPGYNYAEGVGAGGEQQVGLVSNDVRTDAVLWLGTPHSRVILTPAGAEYAMASATDGIQQVGYVSFGDDGVAALWSGTAESFVNLHPGHAPEGWLYSEAMGVSEGWQVGRVGNEELSRAAAWNGTASSFIDIHPASALYSDAAGICKGHICGEVSFPGPEWAYDHAAYWAGPSSAAFVDLHAFLPGHYIESEASGIWSDGEGLVRIVGSAYNALTQSSDAVMWINVALPGACCEGVNCAVAMESACDGAFMGSATLCGPIICCAAPIGSANASQDCDGDLLVDGCTSQVSDCNSNGTDDACEAFEFTTETFAGEPGAFAFNGDAAQQGASAVLTPAVEGQVGSIVRGPLTDGPTRRLRAIFDFRISETLWIPADGFSFSLMDAALHPTTAVFGEDGLSAPGVITIKFNTFENEAGEGSNSMFILYNDEDVAHAASLPFVLADALWHRAIVDLSADGKISVALATNPGDLVTVFDNIQLPNYEPFRANIGFGGRTGGLASRHEVANIRIGVNSTADANGDGALDACDCPADFNGSGTATVQDIFDFLAAYFSGDPRADFNSSEVLSVQDIFDFLAAFFATDCQ